MEDQPWQNNDLNVDSFDFSNNLEPTYRVRMEGRLLDDEFEAMKQGDAGAGGPAPAAGPVYKLSHFFKSISVDFHIPGRRPDQNVEWKKPDRNPPASSQQAAEFDEFCFKRNGDENVNITINLVRHEEPERFLLTPELAAVVDMEEATRQETMMGIWEYIRYHGLQEDEEKRNFRCDDLLKRVGLPYPLTRPPFIGHPS